MLVTTVTASRPSASPDHGQCEQEQTAEHEGHAERDLASGVGGRARHPLDTDADSAPIPNRISDTDLGVMPRHVVEA